MQRKILYMLVDIIDNTAHHLYNTVMTQYVLSEATSVLMQRRTVQKVIIASSNNNIELQLMRLKQTMAIL